MLQATQVTLKIVRGATQGGVFKGTPPLGAAWDRLRLGGHRPYARVTLLPSGSSGVTGPVGLTSTWTLVDKLITWRRSWSSKRPASWSPPTMFESPAQVPTSPAEPALATGRWADRFLKVSSTWWSAYPHHLPRYRRGGGGVERHRIVVTAKYELQRAATCCSTRSAPGDAVPGWRYAAKGEDAAREGGGRRGDTPSTSTGCGAGRRAWSPSHGSAPGGGAPAAAAPSTVLDSLMAACSGCRHTSTRFCRAAHGDDGVPATAAPRLPARPPPRSGSPCRRGTTSTRRLAPPVPACPFHHGGAAGCSTAREP